jgi:hypothetical protein
VRGIWFEQLIGFARFFANARGKFALAFPENADGCGCSELVGVEGICFARAMVSQNLVAGRGERRTRARVADDLIPAAVVGVEKDHFDIDRSRLGRRLG